MWKSKYLYFLVIFLVKKKFSNNDMIITVLKSYCDTFEQFETLSEGNWLMPIFYWSNQHQTILLIHRISFNTYIIYSLCNIDFILFIGLELQRTITVRKIDECLHSTFLTVHIKCPLSHITDYGMRLSFM